MYVQITWCVQGHIYQYRLGDFVNEVCYFMFQVYCYCYFCCFIKKILEFFQNFWSLIREPLQKGHTYLNKPAAFSLGLFKYL